MSLWSRSSRPYPTVKPPRTFPEVSMPDHQPLPQLPSDYPRPGTVWKHFKGTEYMVLDAARCSETKQILVVYAQYPSQSDDDLIPWARPLSEWHNVVTGLDGKPTPRFTFVGVDVVERDEEDGR